MMSFGRYILSFGLVFMLTCQAFAAARIDKNTALTARSIQDPSVLHLECRYAETSFYQSKIALIKTRDARFDYGLSTGHGMTIKDLEFAKDCRVIDHKGQHHALKAFYLPKTYAPGSETDWALIRLDKIRDDKIVRFQLPEVDALAEQDFRIKSNAVNFPKARGIGQNSQVCQSYPSHYIGLKARNLLVHDCRVLPGQSGSPVSVTTKESDLLIGLHLGTGFVMRSKVTGKAGRLGYFRFIDQVMVKEIDTIITRYFN